MCKLRQGVADDFLKVIFNYPTRQAVSLAVSVVRRSLMMRFVPGNLGFQALTRQEYIQNHVTEFANQLYNPTPNVPQVIAFMDGTYAFTEKNSNHRVLRQTFSLHKTSHLVKPVLVVAPDGYILQVQGPYFADGRNNDAAILNNEFERDEENMNEWFQAGDILVLDRGYRDSLPLLRSKGIIVKMPALLKRGQKQFSTEEANESRLVTMCRWINESRNGHIKSIFKFLANIISTTHLPHTGDFYRIAAALINRYRPLINMEGMTGQVALDLLERARLPNVVQALVEVQQLHTTNRQRWVSLSVHHVDDFPRLSLQDLKDITVGIYQVGLAPGYIQDKLSRQEDDDYQIEFLRNEDRLPEPGFLRVRTFSRYRNATRYQVWVAYRPIRNEESGEDEESEEDEDTGIFGYYCTCISGARTLGSCCHVISLLWFLGYARYHDVRFPQTTLTRAILDAANRPPQKEIELD